MKYKGIIFDFNGVLLWDTDLHEQAWKIFSQQIRRKPFTKDEMIDHLHGRTNKDIQTYLLGRQVTRQELKTYTNQKEQMYRTLCLALGENFKLSPGATGLLITLTNEGIPRTIATASEKTNLDFFINHLHLEQWFDITKIVYDDGTFPGKPAPDIYLKAAKKLGLKPSECVVIEDAVSGIKAAFTAGIGKIIAIGPKEKLHCLGKLNGVQMKITSLEGISKEDLLAD